MDTFQLALNFALKWEGGYSNHPNDKGGATNQGITQTTYDAWRRKHGLSTQSVRFLTNSERDTIYKENYWEAINGDQLPRGLAIAAFDWAVNSGPRRALQYYTPNLEQYLLKRESYYRTIGHGSQAVFLRGWLNRVENLRNYLKTI